MAKKPTKRQLVLIDGDTLIYAAALSSERAVEWEHNLWTLHAFLDEAQEKFREILTDLLDAVKKPRVKQEFIIALSDGSPETRWRMGVMDSYKSNRKTTRRPVVWSPLREWVHETYDTFEREGLEGDDILGILATRQTDSDAERIIASIDKDLKTIPGLLFNYGKPELGIIPITEDEADYWHMYQTLTGDRTDGYPGCPGVGDVTARKLLEPCWADVKVGKVKHRIFDTEMAWDIVLKAYQKVNLSHEVALQNARVARILRAEDFDFANKKVKLWLP